VVLRLMLRNGRPVVNCFTHCNVEIVDGDVEMHHHLLFTSVSRPHRSLKVVIALKTCERGRSRYTNRGPPSSMVDTGQPRTNE